jgi:hypothetical protein
MSGRTGSTAETSTDLLTTSSTSLALSLGWQLSSCDQRWLLVCRPLALVYTPISITLYKPTAIAMHDGTLDGSGGQYALLDDRHPIVRLQRMKDNSMFRASIDVMLTNPPALAHVQRTLPQEIQEKVFVHIVNRHHDDVHGRPGVDPCRWWNDMVAFMPVFSSLFEAARILHRRATKTRDNSEREEEAPRYIEPGEQIERHPRNSAQDKVEEREDRKGLTPRYRRTQTSSSSSSSRSDQTTFRTVVLSNFSVYTHPFTILYIYQALERHTEYAKLWVHFRSPQIAPWPSMS